jgi:cytochrome c-type biogenesis protein CcsB
MEPFMFMAALFSFGVSAIFYFWYVVKMRRLSRSGVVTGGEDAPGDSLLLLEPGRFATMMVVLGLVFLTLSMTFRTVVTGHGPFTNMYEYSQAWSWGIVAALLYFQRSYRLKALGVLVTPVAVGFLLYAYSLPSRALPLVPALQQSLLLTIHVAVAMIAYGTFATGFASAILYLFQRRGRVGWLPSASLLDDLGYRAVAVGFPFMTLTIVLGALWADIAWGRYWGWDPKETASLVTWLLYGGYLHARLVAGWRGARSNILLIVGFAGVLFTYFGNYFLGGLHAYA